ncbi:hypothetical protein CYLTODRAFT_125403 [Cylindrobasidium torrendii FP15055 ss-10]|uniref:Uncharacterized protein n=1 Tax=Cylindrobasidium torrendii FP15055 ss-10 TaxID=1314674 RepID=A0A0D7AZI6_9AGAR|nr:hypothetical protein CYLTODRAFT_125403 [Cylindrobasidium torrendii FP15055 ss-10]
MYSQTNVDFAALEQAIAETKLCDLRRRLRPPKTQLDGSLSDLSDLSDVSDVESADRSIRLIPLPGAISSEGRALDGLFDGPLSDLSETSETEDIEASVNNIHSKRALSTHASSKNTAQCPPRNTRVRPSVVGISTNVPKTSSRSTRSVQPSSALGPPPCVSAASNRSTQPRTQRSLARSRDGQSSTPTRHRQASANSNLDVKPPKPRPTKSLPQCSPMALSRLRVASTTSSLPLPPPPPSFAFIPSTAMVSSPPRKKQRRRKPQTVEAKALAKARKNRNRTERRRREERFHGLKDIWVKHMRQTKVYILRNFDITKTRVGTGGWRGSSVNVYEPTQTIQDAIEKGYEEFEWDGSVNIVFLD